MNNCKIGLILWLLSLALTIVYVICLHIEIYTLTKHQEAGNSKIEEPFEPTEYKSKGEWKKLNVLHTFYRKG